MGEDGTLVPLRQGQLGQEEVGVRLLEGVAAALGDVECLLGETRCVLCKVPGFLVPLLV